ncbi:condensation domain-containing protein, partial [Staphylococcus epidermidis]|uniref:condensation domain-containing protein n=1 Tax=Staphylococcus epidermidis TaxID=1282 RepID=UPI0011A5449D
SQKTIYLLSKLNPKDTLYNIPFLSTLSSQLNLIQFQPPLSNFIQPHQILPTQYLIHHNQLKQPIPTHLSPHFQHLTTSLTNHQHIIQSFIQPFHLQQPTQMPLKYIHAPQQHYLFIHT